MLENAVEKENLKVKEFEKVMSSKRSCDNCEKVSEVSCDLSNQKESFHSTEDVPSTSQCRSCDYESDNSNDFNTHIKIKHA